MQTITKRQSYVLYNQMLDEDFEADPNCWLNIRSSTAMQEVDPALYQNGHEEYLKSHQLKLI